MLHERFAFVECAPATEADVLRCHTPEVLERVRVVARLARRRHDLHRDDATRRRCSRPARRSRRCGAAASRWRGRPAITPSARGRWASASSTRSRSPRAGRRPSSASSASRSSTGTCTTATARRTSWPTIRRSSSSRCTSGRSIRAAAGRPSRARRSSTCRSPPGSGDAEYLAAWETVEQAVTRFEPDLLLVSAGFDAHVDDPLADMRLSADGFRELGRRAASLAPRVAAVLEGGYNLRHAARPGRGGARRARRA